MWVLVESGEQGTLGRDSKAFGFATYDEAYSAMESRVEKLASEHYGLDEDDYGCNYDDGYGFVGFDTIFQIFEV